MKGSSFLYAAVALVVLLALAAGLSAAQGPLPQEAAGPPAPAGSEPAVALGSAFTYQGRLLDDGAPVEDTCGFQFSLYDNPVTGTLVAGPLSLNAVPVQDGLFTVPLDFGAVFQGQAYWLEVAVQCSGDAGYTTLDPRQVLAAAPYALSLQPGAVISGTVAGGVLTAFNQNPDGFGVVGLQAGYDTSDLVFDESGGYFGGQTGVFGVSRDPNGYGMIALSKASTAGNGLLSWVQSGGGSSYGVYAQVDSTSGTGVYGLATAGSGTTYGLSGRSQSSQGYGVYGRTTATNGATYGVYGRSDSSEGRGVLGYSSATNGNGVRGEAYRYAVVGATSATSGPSAAILGNAASTGGVGVSGYASANSGTNYGVYGSTDSPSGYGVYYYGGIGGTGLETTIVETPAYGWRHLYNGASTEPLFEEVGSAQLVDGRAVVSIDPVFAQTVNLAEPYQVFLTAQGDEFVLLLVASKGAAAFTVEGVTLDGKPASCAFDYRIVARRLGYEDVRLSAAAAPPSPQEEWGGGE
jgi:hypothetical protein